MMPVTLSATRIAVLVLIAVAISLTTFLPIYPDEVAYKIFLERYFITGGFKQSVTPFCEGAFLVRPGLFLLPAAAFWSLLSQLGGNWLSYRIVPYLGVLAIYAGLIAVNLRKGVTSFWPLLLLLILGPALYGIILLRAEILILSLCMILYLLGESMLRTRRAAPLCLKTVAALLLFSMCVYIHPKALYAAAIMGGVIVLCAFNLPRTAHRMLYTGFFLALTLFITQAAMSLHLQQFMQCHSLPPIEQAIEQAMGKQGVNPFDILHNPARFRENMRLALGPEALDNVIQRLTYQTRYQIHFLPGKVALDAWDLRANGLILGIVLCFIAYIIAKSLACLLFLKGSEERKRFYLTGLTCVSLALPFLLNITRHFYEVSYLLGALMIMAGLLWSFRIAHYGRYGKYGIAVFGAVMISAAMLCVFISWRNFTPAFQNGYEGPGISYQTDKKQLGKAIRHALLQASVSPQEPLIVDDLTYDAVRNHSIVMPITYLGFIKTIPGAIAHYMSIYQAHYGVARCYMLEGMLKDSVPLDIVATLPYTRASYETPLVENGICLFRLK